MITIHQRYRQTDRQTTCDRNTAFCTKVHRAVKSNISAMDGLIVVKFRIYIANRWLFMTQRKIMVIILYA